MTQERLDAIQEREAKTTAGPWDVEGSAYCGPLDTLTVYPVEDGGALAYVQPSWEDAEFIAHARTDVPALLAEVERLRALTTVDEDMVERAAAVRFKREFLQRNSLASNDYASHRLEQARQRTPTAWHQYTHDVRAELEAALGAGEDQ